MSWRVLRGVTALFLALAAALFTVGTKIERASHTETAAQHGAEAPGASLAVSPSPAPISPPTPTTSTPTRDPGLSAPEGSKQREAAERRKREAAAAARATLAPTRATSRTTAVPTRPASASPAAAAPEASAPEGSAAREAEERKGATAATSRREASERLFGVNTESTPVVAAADVLAVVLIGGVLWLSGATLRLTGLLVAATSLGAVGLDLREALHQHDLGKTGLVVLVAGVTALHLASAAGGALLARGRRSSLGMVDTMGLRGPENLP